MDRDRDGAWGYEWNGYDIDIDLHFDALLTTVKLSYGDRSRLEKGVARRSVRQSRKHAALRRYINLLEQSLGKVSVAISGRNM